MSATNKPGRKSEFMAAEEIKGILQGRDKAEQERIIRWASESLGLAVVPGGSGTPPMMASPQQSPSSSAQAGQHAHAELASARVMDLKTFVQQKNPTSDIQFAAVVAYYCRFEAPASDRLEAINQSDLQNAARLAGRDRFPNPYVPLQNAAIQGYLDRAGRGKFKINAVGENLVAMALPSTGGDGNTPRQTGNKRAKQQKKRQPKKPS